MAYPSGTNSNPSLPCQQRSHQDAYPAGDGQDYEHNAQLPTAHGGCAGLAHSAVEKTHVASAPFRAGVDFSVFCIPLGGWQTQSQRQNPHGT